MIIVFHSFIFGGVIDQGIFVCIVIIIVAYYYEKTSHVNKYPYLFEVWATYSKNCLNSQSWALFLVNYVTTLHASRFCLLTDRASLGIFVVSSESPKIIGRKPFWWIIPILNRLFCLRVTIPTSNDFSIYMSYTEKESCK